MKGKKAMRKSTVTCVLAAMLCVASWAHAVSIETVTIGNIGNQPDPATGSQYGNVGYYYEIGTYEVTAAQYAEFLNAVAASDTYGLYDARMMNADGCQIQQSGSDGSYTYSVVAGYEDTPVNYVGIADVFRFCNWLHNGQPTGPQDASTTESGSYPVNGGNGNVYRNSNATWVMPTEDEWYKAAYHQNDGFTSNYFAYATGNDTLPVAEAPAGGNNSVNYDNAVGSTVAVGSYVGSVSPYGTYDQDGNMMEWLETNVTSTTRTARGGLYTSGTTSIGRTFRSGGFSYATNQWYLGFRVARINSVTTPLETVTVGSLGNWGDPNNNGIGAVNYHYDIGRFEVTATQYAEFLNAVAATDPYALYDTRMETDADGCKIIRSGDDGNYTYSVNPGWEDRPVNFISLADSMRFCNWLHNGKPTDLADPNLATEDGAYFTNYQPPTSSQAGIYRNEGARWVIPTDDEWCKAAYHYNNGSTGDYYLYATGSDSAPAANTDPNDDGNSVNYNNVYGHPIHVWAYSLSASPYGTLNQSGNVAEWTETMGDAQTQRIVRGGAYLSADVAYISSAWTYSAPATLNSYYVGLRVVKTTSTPTTCSEAIEYGYDLTADLNNDCFVEWADFGIFASQWQECVDPETTGCQTPWQD